MFETAADDNHVHALIKVTAACFSHNTSSSSRQSSERGSGGRQSAKATVQARSIQTPVMNTPH